MALCLLITPMEGTLKGMCSAGNICVIFGSALPVLRDSLIWDLLVSDKSATPLHKITFYLKGVCLGGSAGSLQYHHSRNLFEAGQNSMQGFFSINMAELVQVTRTL